MSWKKLFDKNNKNDSGIEKKGIRKILDKEGFYIIMFLCVCIVGTTAVWVAKSNIDRLAEEDIQEEQEMNIVQSDVPDITQNDMDDQTSNIIIIDDDYDVSDIDEESSILNMEEEGIESNVAEENIIDENIDPNDSIQDKKGKVLVEQSDSGSEITTTEALKTQEENEAVEASQNEAMAMMWPAQGKIGMDYAVETLTYSKTLEHFTTHHGIDIMAEKNTPVKAALSGEIIEILTDSRLGITISIKHEENLVTRYSNLCTDAMVNIGDKVTQGQTISGVGTSSIFESAEDPHLHFEVLLNGESVNPMDYLAEE
ncbi:peptidoglycan DD-metalloendopeptidase family protein [Wukongibacter sp. M2B1]|uniref:peptidoglycan DD-metalloendopeptidase family protein n=1 Tax=Wukongibacter sp. M2B1 TaxID=3088895 RepID=UPI003D7AD60A